MDSHNDKRFRFDVALSFAAKDRRIAESIDKALRNRGVAVFYDRHFTADLWGANLHDRLQEIYKREARYCIPVISKAYVKSIWTRHEWHSMQERLIEDAQAGYVLPVRLDATQLPGLPTTTAYVEFDALGGDGIADAFCQKIGFLAAVTASKGVMTITKLSSHEWYTGSNVWCEAVCEAALRGGSARVVAEGNDAVEACGGAIMGAVKRLTGFVPEIVYYRVSGSWEEEGRVCWSLTLSMKASSHHVTCTATNSRITVTVANAFMTAIDALARKNAIPSPRHGTRERTKWKWSK